MYLSLYDYQSKANRYRNGLAYLKNRVIPNEKNTIDSHKKKKERNSGIIQKKAIKPQKKRKGTKKKCEVNWKTRNRMAINAYLPIITLNVNYLNAPIKR